MTSSLNEEQERKFRTKLSESLYSHSNNSIVEHYKNIYSGEYNNFKNALNNVQTGGATPAVPIKKSLEEEMSEKCGIVYLGSIKAPIDADACSNMLLDCFKGNDTKCLESFQSMVNDQLNNGFNVNINTEKITNLLENLQIDVNSSLTEWFVKLKENAGNNKEKLNQIHKIESNNGLIEVLNNLIVIARGKNPGTPEYADELAKLNIFGLYPRSNKRAPFNITNLKERLERKSVGDIREGDYPQTGGDEISDKDVRFFDNLQNNYMIQRGSGGESLLPATVQILEEKYNSYKRELLEHNKQIDPADDKIISDLLNAMRKVETELHALVLTIEKVQQLDKKDRADLVVNDENRLVTIKSLNNLLADHATKQAEYNQRGLNLVDILKCIKDGCNAEVLNKMKSNISHLKSQARLEDIKAIITAPSIHDKTHSPTPTSSDHVTTSKKYFFW